MSSSFFCRSPPFGLPFTLQRFLFRIAPLGIDECGELACPAPPRRFGQLACALVYGALRVSEVSLDRPGSTRASCSRPPFQLALARNRICGSLTSSEYTNTTGRLRAVYDAANPAWCCSTRVAGSDATPTYNESSLHRRDIDPHETTMPSSVGVDQSGFGDVGMPFDSRLRRSLRTPFDSACRTACG